MVTLGCGSECAVWERSSEIQASSLGGRTKEYIDRYINGICVSSPQAAVFATQQCGKFGLKAEKLVV
jgi:hypothetical protein